MSVKKLDDRELINLYLTGNENAFAELLGRHKDRIYTQIYLFVKDRDLAEDIFQDVFIKIIKTLRKGKYNHEGKFLQWALRISEDKKEELKYRQVRLLTSSMFWKRKMTTWSKKSSNHKSMVLLESW